MSNTITVIGLGTPATISLSAIKELKAAKKLFLQTCQHPSALPVTDLGLSFTSMDDLYASSEDFDKLNEAIAARLKEAGDCAYAVPGSGIDADLLRCLTDYSCKLRQVPGVSIGQAAMAKVLDMHGAVICKATGLYNRSIDPSVPLCVEELDSKLKASETKLLLQDYFPDDWPVHLAFMDVSGDYSILDIPLFEIDRQTGYHASTVLMLPAAAFESLKRRGLKDLETVLNRLRAPGGCPWDAEQTHFSLKTDLIEESFEVLEAIDDKDDAALCEELGDLLLQVVFHAAIARDRCAFDMRDICTGIVDKLIYRHPHVFGSLNVKDSAEVLVNWDKLKQTEKDYKTVTDTMRAVPKSFPALMRSAKVQKRAAKVGFDWPDVSGAILKLREETEELNAAIGTDAEAFDELGDLLFSAVNAARLLKLDPELALIKATEKFIDRFEQVEQKVIQSGLDMRNMQLNELDFIWNEVKLQKNAKKV